MNNHHSSSERNPAHEELKHSNSVDGDELPTPRLSDRPRTDRARSGDERSEPELIPPEDLSGQDEQPQWEFEQDGSPQRDEPENGPEEPGELSEPEPVGVVTFHFSRQETMNSHGESDAISPENEEQGREERKQDAYRFRFTRAEGTRAERASSAPPRPLTELEEFRGSGEFMRLEAAAVAATEVIPKGDGKLDLDTLEGHNSCKNFLGRLEELVLALKVRSAERGYRDAFSQAYKALYKEGALCYLIEILDSAQESTTVMSYST